MAADSLFTARFWLESACWCFPTCFLYNTASSYLNCKPLFYVLPTSHWPSRKIIFVRLVKNYSSAGKIFRGDVQAVLEMNRIEKGFIFVFLHTSFVTDVIMLFRIQSYCSVIRCLPCITLGIGTQHWKMLLRSWYLHFWTRLVVSVIQFTFSQPISVTYI